MQLLYVCSDFGIKPDGTKGASVHLRAITRALADLGHEMLLLSPHDGPGQDHPVTRLLPPGCPPAEKTGRMLKRWLAQTGYGDSVAKELRPLLYNAWVRERALDALAAAEPDAIIERLSLFGHVGLDLSGELNVPFVVEVNALLTEEAKRFRSLELQRLAEEMERKVLGGADAILVVSSPLSDRLVEMGINRGKIHVIPNGVQLSAFQGIPSRESCRTELGLNGEFVVGFAGSLKAWHGVDDLLAAFKMLHGHDPKSRLLIVGTGPMESGLKTASAKMGIRDAVIFTGAVAHERVPRMLRAMDVAVAPFKQVDNFYFSPIKLFEYMASGTCVIASPLGQIAEIIEDGANGLLCEPEDAADLYEKLCQARHSVDLRERLASRALRLVCQNYTWKHAAEKTSSVISRLVEANRRDADRVHSYRQGITAEQVLT